MTDELVGKDGKKFKLAPPNGDSLPSRGFDPGVDTFQRPPEDGSSIVVKIDSKSDRLQGFLFFLSFFFKSTIFFDF